LALVVVSVLLVGGFVAGVVLTVGGWHQRETEQPVKGWVTTTGTVVGIAGSKTGKGTVYGPIVSFTDESGVLHQFAAPATGPGGPHLGGAATVSYDPANPSRAHDLSDDSWRASFVTGVVILSVFGAALVLVLCVGLAVILRRRRRVRSA
jgi:hypothetical protein